MCTKCADCLLKPLSHTSTHTPSRSSPSYLCGQTNPGMVGHDPAPGTRAFPQYSSGTGEPGQAGHACQDRSQVLFDSSSPLIPEHHRPVSARAPACFPCPCPPCDVQAAPANDDTKDEAADFTGFSPPNGYSPEAQQMRHLPPSSFRAAQRRRLRRCIRSVWAGMTASGVMPPPRRGWNVGGRVVG